MNIPTIYDRLAELAFRKLSGQLSEEEEQEIENIIGDSPEKKKLFDEMIDPVYTAEQLMIMDELDVDASWEKLNQDFRPPRKKWGWIQYTLAAASILIVLSLAAYFFLYEKKEDQTIVQNENSTSAGNIAIRDNVGVIINADGTSMAVDQAQSGNVGYINGKPVYKKDSMLIFPEIISAGTIIKALPGKQLPVLLCDGTKAWLSGNTELRFTDGFATGKRKLALKGEAHFEVFKSGTIPFAVMARGMDVTVWGTSFTVSAYDEKGPVTTSLFSGKVTLTAGDRSMLLLPKEVAVFENNEFSKKKLTKRSVDRMEGMKAWQFIFDGDMKSILEEVAKNYDCTIEYIGKMPGSKFEGSFSRNRPLKMLLGNLSTAMKIGLTLQGNTIIADFTKNG